MEWSVEWQTRTWGEEKQTNMFLMEWSEEKKMFWWNEVRKDKNVFDGLKRGGKNKNVLMGWSEEKQECFWCDEVRKEINWNCTRL